ncbi:MAG: hypothetical protein BGP04_00270 [Rhizobiales bacterium 62-17]|nr:DUF4189 domain-containing protein [Hyphomicrobiales bacterium]OJY03916.1 MAG: hypothetical protein BGP04_00270 [Rhizobiales bacterium 62-17]
MTRRVHLWTALCLLLCLPIGHAALAQSSPKEGGTPTTPAPSENAAEIAFWNSVKDSKNPAELRAYLQAFPSGVFAPLAKVRIEGLEKAAAAPPPAPAPSPVMPQQARAFDLSNPAQIRELQNKLYNLNYRVTRRDGVFDSSTQNAIRDWQKTVGLPTTGQMNDEQWRRLNGAKLSTVWGAIAYTARGAYGSTFNRPSREDAEQEATRECQRRAGRRAECRLMAGADASCMAMASYRTENRRRVYFGSMVALRPQLSDAISEALRQCNDEPNAERGCSARTTLCADGSHKR